MIRNRPSVTRLFLLGIPVVTCAVAGCGEGTRAVTIAAHVGGRAATSTIGSAGCVVTTITPSEEVICSFDKGNDQVGAKVYTPEDPTYSNLASVSTLGWDGTEGDPAPGALKVVTPFSGYKQFVELERSLSVPRDLSNRQLFMRLKVMPGFSPTQAALPYWVFLIKTGSQYVIGSTYENISAYGKWVEHVVDPATMTTYGSSPLDLTQVVAIGLQLHTPERADADSPAALPTQATFYVDTIGTRPLDVETPTEVCVPVDKDAENRVVLAPADHSKPVPGDRWRGFNLMGRYALQWPETNQGFKEKEFSTIADLEFNYARLPVDYRTYTAADDWLRFDSGTIQALDDAVAWGQEYGVHVDLCLHRAPGYCSHDWNGRIVDLPADQDLDLWTDPVAQDAFVQHWRLLASRYRRIPSEYLSFNLVNEPDGMDEATYVALMTRTIRAIREISPDRIVVVDGTNFANDPIFDPEFVELDNVVQSKHAYDFQRIQFYDTSFNPGSETWPVPHWPPVILDSYLYGPYQASSVGSSEPLVIEGSFPVGTRVTMHINVVNSGARFVMQSDQELLVDEKLFYVPGDPSWTVIDTWNSAPVYGKTYDADYSATLTSAATSLSFGVTEQNMLDFTKITLELTGQTYEFVPSLPWGVPQARFSLQDGTLVPVAIPSGAEKYYDINRYLEDWRQLAKQGVRVMVGEFLQSRQVPYADAYRFYAFLLGACKQSGFGWAHWSLESTNPPLEGAFINNARQGGNYEDYNGYRIDWNMARLFQSN